MKTFAVVILMMALVAGFALAERTPAPSAEAGAVMAPVAGKAAALPAVSKLAPKAIVSPVSAGFTVELPANNSKCLSKFILAGAPKHKCYPTSDNIECPFFCQDSEGRYCSVCNCPR